MECMKEQNQYIIVDICKLTPKGRGIAVADFRARVKKQVYPDIVGYILNPHRETNFHLN